MSHRGAGGKRGSAASRWAWLGLAMPLAGAWAAVAMPLAGAWTVRAMPLARAGSAAAAEEAPVCSSRNLGGRLVYGAGRIEIPVPPERVHDVLTDYVRLPDFVTAMDSCIVVGRDSLGVVVRQVGTIQLLVRRSLRLTLRFREEPPSRLRFEIVSGDFPVYYGAWEFEPSSAGTVLEYSVTMRPPAFVPTWLVRPSIERTLCRTLVETGREAERRDRLVAKPGKSDPETLR